MAQTKKKKKAPKKKTLVPFGVYRLFTLNDFDVSKIPIIPSTTTIKNDLRIINPTLKIGDILVFIQTVDQMMLKYKDSSLLEFYLPNKGYYVYFPSGLVKYLELTSATQITNSTIATWGRHSKTQS